MLVNVLILSLFFNESGATGLAAKPCGATGLQRAGALIKEPFEFTQANKRYYTHWNY